MPDPLLGDYYMATVFACLFGPFIFGVVLTTVAVAVTQKRRNGSLMSALGIAVIIATYTLSAVSLHVLMDNDWLRALPGNPVHFWYFFHIGLGTTGIIASAVYCWFRSGSSDD